MQKTADEMRISDWSSDVCSSDLVYRDMGPLKGVAWREEGEGLGAAAARNTWRMLVAAVPACFHRDTQKTLVESGKITLMLMFIIANALLFAHVLRSEERRVRERVFSTCRSRWSPYH